MHKNAREVNQKKTPQEKIKEPRFFIPVAYFGGCILCLISEAILIAVGSADISTIWYAGGTAIALGVIALGIARRIWCTFSATDTEEMNICTIHMSIVVGFMIGLASGMIALGYFQNAWYYESLVHTRRFSPSNHDMSSIPSSNAAIDFTKNSGPNTKFGGHAFIWKRNSNGKMIGNLPDRVYCAAPIVEGNWSTSASLNKFNFWAVSNQCCKGMGFNNFPNEERIYTSIPELGSLQLSYSDCPGWETSINSNRSGTGIDLKAWDPRIVEAVNIVAQLNNVSVGDNPRFLGWQPNFAATITSEFDQAYWIIFLIPALWPLLACALACALGSSSG